MATYRNIENGEIREISAELFAAWLATGNPKASVWEPWAIDPPPPTPPDPQWVAFGNAAQSSTSIKMLMLAALQLNEIPLVLGLGVGLGKAADGSPGTFLGSWALAGSLNLISAELLAEVTALAGQFSLPSEFVAALQPA